MLMKIKFRIARMEIWLILVVRDVPEFDEHEKKQNSGEGVAQLIQSAIETYMRGMKEGNNVIDSLRE